MKFAVIIPDRGDRPEFLNHCIKQLERFTLIPDKVCIVCDPPKTDDFDIVSRIKEGIELVKQADIDLVFIMENDDFYPPDYFARFHPHFVNFEFFGDEYTTYYNLKNKTYRTWHHPRRSSLFTTGFKISALDRFQWPDDNERFLDIKLWQYANSRKRKFVRTDAIGIKHGIGKTGGKGHYMRFTDVDMDLKFLKSRVNGSIDFYKSIMEKL